MYSDVFVFFPVDPPENSVSITVRNIEAITIIDITTKQGRKEELKFNPTRAGNVLSCVREELGQANL